MQLRLDTINDLQGVFSLSHDDDAGYNFAVSIQVRYAAAQFRTEHHLPNIFYPDRRAGLVRGENNISEVLHRFGIAASTHHVLGAAKLEQATADFTVAAPHCVRNPADRNAVRLETPWINIDLVLLPKATERRHFRHAGR